MSCWRAVGVSPRVWHERRTPALTDRARLTLIDSQSSRSGSRLTGSTAGTARSEFPALLMISCESSSLVVRFLTGAAGWETKTTSRAREEADQTSGPGPEGLI